MLFLYAALLYPVLAVSNQGGAPPRRTGAPDDLTCAASGCHDSFDLNTGAGSVQIQTDPMYTPSEPLNILIRVEEGTVYGFEITARDTANQFVGSWTLDAETRFAGLGIEYVTHSSPSVTGEWTINWMPPDFATGPVTFYAAGNAANGNGSGSGDHIYTTVHTINPMVSNRNERPSVMDGYRLEPGYPNPATDRVVIEYGLGTLTPVQLILYDLQGRSISVAVDGIQAAGIHRIDVDLAEVPAGMYIYELRVPVGTFTRTLAVLP